MIVEQRGEQRRPGFGLTRDETSALRERQNRSHQEQIIAMLLEMRIAQRFNAGIEIDSFVRVPRGTTDHFFRPGRTPLDGTQNPALKSWAILIALRERQGRHV
jgi:hypothetical protein